MTNSNDGSKGLLPSLGELPGDIVSTTDDIVVAVGDAATELKPFIQVVIKSIDSFRYIAIVAITATAIWWIRKGPSFR